MPSAEQGLTESKADLLLKVLEAKGKCLENDCKAFQKNSANEN